MRLLYLFIAVAIISAGCVGLPGVPGSGGAGASLGSLSFSPSKLNSNQLTKLEFSVQNNGEYDISDASIYLFGLPNDWTMEEGSASDTFSLVAPGIRGGKSYPGEKKDFLWVLRAPANLPRDESFSFEARARVCYTYKTLVTGKMEVISESEWLEKQPSQHSIATQQSSGPIKVNIISTQPLVAETETKMKIRITNAGDGTVTDNDCSAFESDRTAKETEAAIMKLNRLTIAGSVCDFGSDDIYLQKGQSKDLLVSCTPPSLGDSPVATDDFSIELNYNYYSDRSADVVVVGTAEATTGGAARPGVVSLKDVCTKLCDANGQKPKDSDARGICRSEKEASAYDYPPGNTFGFQVLLWPLGTDEADKPKAMEVTKGVLSKIYSDKYDSLTVKDLNLHDARLGDFASKEEAKKNEDGALKSDSPNGLLDMTVGNLDSGTLTKQYTQKMIDYDTDGDGLPDYFEEKYAESTKIMSPTSRDADKNKVLDPNEKIGSRIYKQLYEDSLKDTEKGSDVNVVYRKFGIAKYICENYNIGVAVGKAGGGNVGISSDKKACVESIEKIKLMDIASISFNGKDYRPMDIQADRDALRNLPTESLSITAIAGFKISDIAKNSPSRKLRTISDIKIEDFYVKSLPDIDTGSRLQNFLKYGKCEGKAAPTAYSRDIVCKCMKDASKPLDILEKSANAQCDATCKNTLHYESGTCSPKTYDKSTVCDSSKVVQIRQLDAKSGTSKMGCTGTDKCICTEKTLATLVPEDKAIICGK